MALSLAPSCLARGNVFSADWLRGKVCTLREQPYLPRLKANSTRELNSNVRSNVTATVNGKFLQRDLRNRWEGSR